MLIDRAANISGAVVKANENFTLLTIHYQTAHFLFSSHFGRSVGPTLQTEIVKWIALNFGTGIHGPLRMNPTDLSHN